MPLETELATYKAKLPEMADKEGKFVLIHGTDVVDFYSCYEDAIKAGCERCMLAPFLVKQVNSMELAQFVSRFANAGAPRLRTFAY